MRIAAIIFSICFLLLSATASVSADIDWQALMQTGERCSGLAPELILSVLWNESAGNPNAVNINGVGGFHPRTASDALKVIYHYNSANVDIGLMQINWKTWGPYYGLTPADLLDPVVNICAGSLILRNYVDAYKGSWQGVGRYNAVNYSKQVGYAQRINRTLRYILSRNQRRRK